jgi:hypothetical protein
MADFVEVIKGVGGGAAAGSVISLFPGVPESAPAIVFGLGALYAIYAFFAK